MVDKINSVNNSKKRLRKTIQNLFTEIFIGNKYFITMDI